MTHRFMPTTLSLPLQTPYDYGTHVPSAYDYGTHLLCAHDYTL